MVKLLEKKNGITPGRRPLPGTLERPPNRHQEVKVEKKKKQTKCKPSAEGGRKKAIDT